MDFGMQFWQIRQKYLARRPAFFTQCLKILKIYNLFQNSKFFFDICLFLFAGCARNFQSMSKNYIIICCSRNKNPRNVSMNTCNRVLGNPAENVFDGRPKVFRRMSKKAWKFLFTEKSTFSPGHAECSFDNPCWKILTKGRHFQLNVWKRIESHLNFFCDIVLKMFL